MSDTPRTDAEPTHKAGIAQTCTVNIAFARQLERELAEAQEELNDKRKFCYAVEQALDGLKGDYVEIIVALRKDAEKYRYCFNAAIDAAMKERK